MAGRVGGTPSNAVSESYAEQIADLALSGSNVQSDAIKLGSAPTLAEQGQPAAQAVAQPVSEPSEVASSGSVAESRQAAVQQADAIESKPITASSVIGRWSAPQVTTKMQASGYGNPRYEEQFDVVSGQSDYRSWTQPETDEMIKKIISERNSVTNGQDAKVADAEELNKNTADAAMSSQQEPTVKPIASKMAEVSSSDIGSANEADDVVTGPAKIAPRYYSVPSDTFSAVQDEEKERAAASIARKAWSGNAFTEKAVAATDGDKCTTGKDSFVSIEPIDISVGDEIVYEMIREPGNSLIDLVNQETGSDFTLDQIIDDMQPFIWAVNRSYIEVVSVKSPVVGPKKIQRRRLRIHSGRGVKLHRTQTKSYNLDFDGDGVSVSIEKRDYSVGAMSCFIDADGKALIDTDFFPLSELGTVDKSKFSDVLKGRYAAYSGNDLSALVDAAYDLVDARMRGEDEGQKWVVLLRAMADVASGRKASDSSLAPEDYDLAMSDIFKRFYDTMVLAHKFDLASKATNPGEKLYELEQVSDLELVLIDTINDIARGKLPPNFQTFCSGLNQYLGEEESKNVYFRIGAKFAKVIKFDQFFFKGEDVVGTVKNPKAVDGLVRNPDGSYSATRESLYKLTLNAGMSMFMSGRFTIGEKVAYAQKIAKWHVYREVGLPGSYIKNGKVDYNTWLKKFKESYNAIMRIVDAAGFEFSCDLDRYPDVNIKEHMIKSNDLSAYIDPIKIIYGDIGLDNVLPDADFVNQIDGGWHLAVDEDEQGRKILQILSAYQYATVRDFAYNNRVAMKFSPYAKKNVEKDQIYARDIAVGLADKKTSAASTYSKNIDNLLVDFASAFKEISQRYKKLDGNATADDLADFKAFVGEMVSALHLSGPAMFNYFGMGNPSAMLNSEFGRICIDASSMTADDVKSIKSSISDMIGGARMSMVFQYRMHRIDDLNTRIQELLESEELVDYFNPDIAAETEVPAMINRLQNRLEQEFAALESSSDLWRVLIAEIRDGDNSAFAYLKDTEGECLGTYSDCEGENGCHYWSENERRRIDFSKPAGADRTERIENTHNSLTEVLADPMIPRDMKKQIAVDVVRMHTGFYQMKRYEVEFQLDIDADPSMVSLSLLAYHEQPSIIDAINQSHKRAKDVMDKMDGFKKLKRSVHEARIWAKQHPGALQSYLSELSDNPGYYCDIDDYLYVDAYEAQMDKSSKSSEKSKQELLVNAAYNAVMTQSGGMTTAQYRTQDRMLGRIREDMLSPYDIIHALADPNFSLIVFNGQVEWTLSRMSLCGDDTEEALWDMLENNPRIASYVRPAHVTAGKKGGKGQPIYRSVNGRFKEQFVGSSSRSAADKAKGVVKSWLGNRSMFGAMVSMFVPIHNRRSDTVREPHRRMFNAMQAVIVNEAAGRNAGKRLDVRDPDNGLLASLGVTVDSLMDKGKMGRKEANRWYANLAYFLDIYVGHVQRIIKPLSADQIDGLLASYNADDVEFDFDADSIRLAQDNRQTLNGSKTETSTGVEGNITRDNLGTALWSMAAKGRYAVIDGNMSPEELSTFIGCQTNVGIFDGSNIEELEDLAGDDPVVVLAPEGWEKEDETLSNGGPQITTLGRSVTVKRDKSAEEYNLKIKRSGSEKGRDSINSDLRYDPDAMKNIGLIERAYREGDLFAAKFQLAKLMKRADDEEGYSDMDLSDYMDLADIIILEASENIDGTEEKRIVIRTISEISFAIRLNMQQSTLENGSPKDIIDEAASIASQVGFSQRLGIAESHDLALAAASSIMSYPTGNAFKALNKPSESSFERNYNLLQVFANRIIADNASGVLERKPDDAHDRGMYSQDKLNRLSNGSMGKNGKANLGIMCDPAISPIVRFANWNYFNKKDPYHTYNFYCPINITHAAKSKKKSVEDNVSAGPQSVWILEAGASPDKIKNAIDKCEKYGMSLFFTDVSALGDFYEVYKYDITEAPVGNGYMMIPFFTIANSGGYCCGQMSPASFQDHPSWYSVLVEDEENFYGLSNTELLTDARTASEIHCTSSGTEYLSFKDLFHNVLTCEDVDEVTGCRICDLVHDIRLADINEIRRDIVDYADGGPSFDLGISVMNPHSDEVLQKFGLQIEEYRQKFYSEAVNNNGFVREGRPDRILNWARCEIGSGRNAKAVYAPIILFPTGTALHAPTRFMPTDWSVDDTSKRISVGWSITEGIFGQVGKYHDGSNPGGKAVTFFDKYMHLGDLRNGMRIDHMLAGASNTSRRTGTEPISGTMQSLALAFRFTTKFNFAELDGAFPDNTFVEGIGDVKSTFASRRLECSEWAKIEKEMKRTGGRYHADPDIDGLVRELVHLAVEGGTASPSDLLANKYGNGYVNRYVDYSYFFRADEEFENALLKFYNMLDEHYRLNNANRICPPSIDSYDDGIGYLFKPVSDPGGTQMRGVLQMSVPYYFPDGSVVWRWSNVYVSLSFFNDDYTGMHKPGLNGASETLEQDSAMAIAGLPVEGRNFRAFARYAASPSYRGVASHRLSLDYDAFIKKER